MPTPDIQVRIIVEIETAVRSAISRRIGPVTPVSVTVQSVVPDKPPSSSLVIQ